MNFQTGPAETTNYLILGYSVILGVILVHLASLRLRFRNAQDDLEALSKLSKNPPRRKAAPPKKRRK
ncbi:MAG: hypothetical protein ACRDFQ_09360 [Anaerolineales bacterium]